MLGLFIQQQQLLIALFAPAHHPAAALIHTTAVICSEHTEWRWQETKRQTGKKQFIQGDDRPERHSTPFLLYIMYIEYRALECSHLTFVYNVKKNMLCEKKKKKLCIVCKFLHTKNNWKTNSVLKWCHFCIRLVPLTKTQDFGLQKKTKKSCDQKLDSYSFCSSRQSSQLNTFSELRILNTIARGKNVTNVHSTVFKD